MLHADDMMLATVHFHGQNYERKFKIQTHGTHEHIIFIPTKLTFHIYI